MKNIFSSSSIRSLLSWLVKLGTLGFNLPATMGVASDIVTLVTGTTDPILTLVLVVSGVVVMDTVFLGSWHELDINKTQDDSDKLADAITVVVMYLLTILVGLLHGEGWAGLLFRVPMGIAVARSTWKTISYSMRRSGDDTKGKNMPLRVRWEQMQSITTRGVAIIRYELTNFLADLQAQSEVMSKHREAKKNAGIESVVDMASIYREQAVASAKSNNINLVASPTLNSKITVTADTTNSSESITPSNSKSIQRYTIEPDGVEWVATCLHQGCSMVIRNGSKDSVRRRIVGHGNKHKNDVVVETVESTIEVVEGEVSQSTNVDPTGF